MWCLDFCVSKIIADAPEIHWGHTASTWNPILNTWNSLECLFRRLAWMNWRGLFDGFKTITGSGKLCLSLRRQFPHASPKQLMSTCQRSMRFTITYLATRNIDCGCQINSPAQYWARGEALKIFSTILTEQNSMIRGSSSWKSLKSVSKHLKSLR